jgi:hypothetical protein
MILWPSPDDERNAALRELDVAPDEKRAIAERDPDRWRRHGLLAKMAFFVLTLIGVGAFSGFARYSVGSFINGVIVIAIAELLITKKRFFATGVETALWLSGVFFFLFALPHSGKPEALLAIAAAIGLAGLRLLNPLFGALAAVCVAVYVAAIHSSQSLIVLAALSIAIAASVAQMFEWRRRSTERLFQMIAILLPLTGVIAVEFEADVHHGQIAIPFAAAALIILTIGIARRQRALLIAGALNLGIAAYEASYLSDAGVEMKLIVAGALLITIATTLSRVLRGRTTGFVLTPSSMTGYDEAMQIAGAIHVTPPAHAPAAGGGFESGGGGFGGGGASADY